MTDPNVPVHDDATIPATAEEKMMKCLSCPATFEFDPEKEWVKQCYDCFKDEMTRRPCTACGKRKIVVVPGQEWQKICGTCYTNSPLRLCDGCKQPALKAVEPWRQLCKECWPRRHALLRICKICNDKPIKKNAEKWVETCMSCYMEKKKLYYEPCHVCNSEKLIKRKTAPACRACMIRNGDIIHQKVLMSAA